MSQVIRRFRQLVSHLDGLGVLLRLRHYSIHLIHSLDLCCALFKFRRKGKYLGFVEVRLLNPFYKGVF